MIHISLAILILIESSGNPMAWNHLTNARGLLQVTPICLVEYNHYHTRKYSEKDLFNGTINQSIAAWYLEKRIPRMLRHYRKPVNVNNVLTAYNAGIKYAGKYNLPTETRNYIDKYHKMGGTSV